MKKLTTTEVNALALLVATKIREDFKPNNRSTPIYIPVHVYAIPRGGIPAAYAIGAHFNHFTYVSNPDDADLFIDDLIDSGQTRREWTERYPDTPFYTLLDKNEPGPYQGKWIVFPWEISDKGDESATDIVTRLLQFIGEDPDRQGLIETPARVTKAWQHWCSGYGKDPSTILKVFEDGAQDYDQMVTVKDIPIYSHCEHHLAPIIGTVSISYIPNGKIVGLSKLSRLADMYARRLQVQERLTCQIADALVEHLNPVGVGVIIKARHLCMESRGICQQGHHTVTTALRGALREDQSSREEFLSLVQ